MVADVVFSLVRNVSAMVNAYARLVKFFTLGRLCGAGVAFL
jgi:hypothetical protein